MIPEMVQSYARVRGLSEQDALQTFLQVVVLRNLRHDSARLIGGTALVLGHGNPRFSEDVDLTQISRPAALGPFLAKAAKELEGWLDAKILLTAPKARGATWILTARWNDSELKHLRLHVDSQSYRAHSKAPLVIEFPGLSVFAVESVSVLEIMADKVIAVAFRRYLGGRDLFDLWFHWLRHDKEPFESGEISTLVSRKLADRGLQKEDWARRFRARLLVKDLDRARQEWRRYLPRSFQGHDVLEDILSKVRGLERLLPS